MAISPRASAPEGRGWTIVRPLGARAVPTSAALQELPSGSNELLVVQTFRTESDRTGDPVRDLRALINVRNPNVARLKEVVEKDGSVHVVSHFVDGETLGALREQGPIPFGVELRILVDVLTGLAALNGVKDAKLKPINFVHGEVAPANVVIGTDGVAKIVQLCGVHAIPGAQGSDTVGWLAPEILLADDTFDQRVDVYGVGVMLWEALTGSTLFPETNAGAIVTRHLSGRIKKPTIPADAPWAEPFVEIAMKAISTDPGSRYSNAGELAAEIKRVAKSNLAMTPKVAALVKERAGEKIAARRAALGGGAVAGAAKVAVPKPTQTRLAAPLVSTPKPPVVEAVKVPETPIVLAPHDGEDLLESAIKPVVAPPEPSVHERTTTPSPIPEEKAKDLVEEQAADFSDFSLDDEEPAGAKAPPGPPPKKDVASPFPAPDPAPVPTPPPAFVAEPPPIAASPFPPVDVPAAAPAATPPFAEEAAAPSSPRSQDLEPAPGLKRSPALWIGLGIAAVVVLLISLKTCTSKTDATAGGAPSASAVTTAAKAPEPKPTEDPATTAIAANTGTGAAPTATEAPTPATAEPSASAAPATEPPPKVDTPPQPKAVGPAPTPKPTAKPKPSKPAYDPQGI